MSSKQVINRMDVMRSYSSAFSRSAITDIIKYGDYSQLGWLYSEFGSKKDDVTSYGDYLKALYLEMVKNYRCEYVFKNELVGYIIKHYKKNNTVTYNELRVGKSIVDIAVFNGESSAFEIKTEFDSPRRLEKQLGDYQRLFDKCYVVVPAERVPDYIQCVDERIGVMSLSKSRTGIAIRTDREAVLNETIDSDLLISCLRTKEYEHVVKDYFGGLPDVSSYEMFDKCREMMMAIPNSVLKSAFCEMMKKRKANLEGLSDVPKELRQISLSLNLMPKEVSLLLNRLEKKLK